MNATTNTTDADLLARALAVGWENNYVTAPGWSTGATSGSGIDGVLLRVTTRSMTNQVACPVCDGMSFPAGTDRPFCDAMDAARAAADAQAESHGHLVRYATTDSGRRSMVEAIERAARRGVR